MSTDWGKSERVRGGDHVDIMRLDDTKVAIVFTLNSKEDADVLADRALKGLKKGEFKMRLRGKVTGVKGEF